jgi:hypothetical protein
MTCKFFSAAVLAVAFGTLVACNETPLQPVAVPSASDPGAYRPMPAPKPLPPSEGYTAGGAAQQPGPAQPGSGAPGAGAPGAAPSGGLTISPNQSIQNEDAFVAVYAKHNARMMVFVNRTLTGDPVPDAQLQAIAAGGQTQGSELSSADYQMIETSIAQYFNNSGRVDVRDSEAARARLNREQILRVENGDSAVNRLLATEHLADVIVHITANPTSQSAFGNRAIRMNAKAVGTTDGRVLALSSLDLPLPATRPIINDFTRHMTEDLMRQMAIKWALPAEFDPIEVRIYKAASIDDSSKVASWIKKAPGVSNVDLRSATGGSATSYAVLHVAFNGSPWQLYEEVKDSVGQSQGIKAVDLQNNTINLEITGPMNLVTTTRAVETTTTTETHVTEERRVDPVRPAPPATQPQ